MLCLSCAECSSHLTVRFFSEKFERIGFVLASLVCGAIENGKWTLSLTRCKADSKPLRFMIRMTYQQMWRGELMSGLPTGTNRTPHPGPNGSLHRAGTWPQRPRRLQLVSITGSRKRTAWKNSDQFFKPWIFNRLLSKTFLKSISVVPVLYIRGEQFARAQRLAKFDGREIISVVWFGSEGGYLLKIICPITRSHNLFLLNKSRQSDWIHGLHTHSNAQHVWVGIAYD